MLMKGLKMMRMNSLGLLPVVVLAACTTAGAPESVTWPNPVTSAAAADSLLTDLATVDPSIRIDARYRDSGNFTGAPLPGYGANRMLLRREAAAALGRVQDRLEQRGLGLLVWDAYRPVRATTAMVEWAERTGQVHLLDEGYIARRSGHNLGIAIDLTAVDLETGRPLDMGTPYDTFGAEAHTANATGEAARNRAVLVEAMEAEGFDNYDQEWWHFSYPVENPVPFDIPITETSP